MLRAKHMGFKSVKRVEVKAETTTPGEMRTTTDAHGTRVSSSRGRRTLPKLEFTVDEDGAVLHGPQRCGPAGNTYPFYTTGTNASTVGSAYYTSNNNQTEATNNSIETGGYESTAMERELRSLAANFQTTHTRNLPPSPNNNNNQSEEDLNHVDETINGNIRHTYPPGSSAAGAFPLPPSNLTTTTPKRSETMENNNTNTPPVAPPMKECILNDTRATTLAIKYDRSIGKFVCGSSIERFSGHTGVCRVLGSKKYPIIPHSLQVGDLLRIGSVGLVVCEMNRTADEATQESLNDEDFRFLKENYLSVPLQQTFHPTETNNNNNEDMDAVDEEDDDMKHLRTVRAGETSDEGDSEEDRKAGRGNSNNDEDNMDDAEGNRFPVGVSGMVGKKFCYICYDGDEEPEENPLVAPCNCKGDTKYVHLECLQRWNNNLDADGNNPNQKVCAVTNTDGLDVCSICKATYLTSVKLEDGRVVSLLAKKLPPPYVTFAVVTQHETRNRSTALTNTRFQLSFANLPRNQQFLTIGRSTTNNMTLRYRTVSQLHAKIKFQDQHFYLFDASSSNGTMLFLSKPLELDWNKTMHVKIGRTILTLKSKKRWKWAGSNTDSASGEGEAVGRISSPLARTAETPRGVELMSPASTFRNTFRIPSHRGDPSRLGSSESLLNDPSADIAVSPFSGPFRPLNRTFTAPGALGSQPRHRASSQDDRLNSTHTMEDFADVGPSTLGGMDLLSATRGATSATPIHRRRPGIYIPASVVAEDGDVDVLGTPTEFRHRHEHVIYDFEDSLSQLNVGSSLMDLDSPVGHRDVGSPIITSNLMDREA